MVVIVEASEPEGPSTPSSRELAWRRLVSNKMALLGIVVIVLLGLTAAAAPLLAPYDPTRQDYTVTRSSPSWKHPLGTDQLGRDTLSRLLHGARVSLGVGVLAQLIALVIGVPVGLIAGFASNRMDNLIMRGVDIVYAFPDLLLIILLRAVFGGSLYLLVIAVGLAAWPGLARLTRGQTLALRNQEFVLAARAIGSSVPHILWRHLLPNALGPVIVAATFLVPKAIFAEAALSYIGIGVNPPTPSWGAMVRDGYSLVFSQYEQVLFPSLAIIIVMLAFTFLGDGLRDLLDPRSNRR